MGWRRESPVVRRFAAIGCLPLFIVGVALLVLFALSYNLSHDYSPSRRSVAIRVAPKTLDTRGVKPIKPLPEAPRKAS